MVFALFILPYLSSRKLLKECSSAVKESSARIAEYDREYPLVHDPEFGDVRNHQICWRAETGPTLAGVQVDLTGFTTGTPTPVQRQTFKFVKENANELLESALAAGRKTIADASAGAQADDLRITSLTLQDKELYGFDLSMESESCANVAPDGVIVTFRDKVVLEAVILKDEETDKETATCSLGD